jgi:hypothetical protein
MSIGIRIKTICLMYYQARTYTISMPYRVQRIEEFFEQLESGDLKLRVRVLEVVSLTLSDDICWILLLSVRDNPFQ